MDKQQILNSIMERLRRGETVPVKKEYADFVSSAAEESGISLIIRPETHACRKKQDCCGNCQRLMFKRKDV